MVNIIVELSKYLLIFIIVLYTFQCYTVFMRHSEKRRSRIFRRQNILMFMNHFVAFLVMVLQTNNMELVALYGAQFIYLAATIILFRFLYPKAARLVINNMCMLLSIGFIIITRLSFTKSLKQFQIVVVSTIIALIIPVIIRKMKFLRKLTWLYAGVGIVCLLLVLILANKTGGAQLALNIAGISLQLSEFVKIIFVFFVASILSRTTKFRDVVIVTAVAAAHVLILVLSTDLGGALIFFITYLIMLYVASRNPCYMLGGLLAGSAAAVVAYNFFSHVKNRVANWQDPFATYFDVGGGMQLAQSLFAIGTGGWFGLGLLKGVPNQIPVVEEDFVFAAIAEELGGIYALCVILICMSVFIMFVNIAMQIREPFYKLVALGLGTMYGFQVFLTIGGVINFIPSTGVTLPLVSYGGSSMLSTLIMFAIIQGLYILREDEGEELEKRKAERRSKEKEENFEFQEDTRVTKKEKRKAGRNK